MDNNVFKMIYIIVSITLLYLLYKYVYQNFINPPVKEGMANGLMSAVVELTQDVGYAIAFIATIPMKIASMVMAASSLAVTIPIAFGVLMNDMKDTWKNLAEAIPGGASEFGTHFIVGMEHLGKGTFEIGDVVETTFVDTLAIVTDTISNLQYVFEYIEKFSIFLGKYIYCGFLKLINLPQCFFYYVLETLGYIIYFPIGFSIYLIKLFSGFDLNPAMDQFFAFLDVADNVIYDLVGFRMFRFSPAVIKQCFNCDVDPLPEFPKEVFVKDYNDLNQLFENVSDKLDDAVSNEMVPAFQEMIGSVTKSADFVFSRFSDSYNSVLNGFKDGRKVVDDGIHTSLNLIPNLWSM